MSGSKSGSAPGREENQSAARNGRRRSSASLLTYIRWIAGAFAAAMLLFSVQLAHAINANLPQPDHVVVVVDLNEWQVAGIQRAIASLDRDKGISHKQVKEWVSWDRKKARPAPKPSAT